MNAVVDELTQTALPLIDEPMQRHTSWRVGGPAERFYEPTSIAELQGVLAALPPQLPVLWLGLGSNLLVRDGGIRGAVIATSRLPRELERRGETHVRAGAGLPCALLARQCVRWELGPAAFFAGIPGTVGGALAMNAGAFGGETWTHVESVATIDRRGRVHERARAQFAVSYRSVRAAAGSEAKAAELDEWFLAATFALAPDKTTAAGLKKMLARRNATQPLGIPSCGSVFRNPPGDFAGRLIESAGLKGTSIGGAAVSDKHANFIVNTGGATAADIETLIERVRGAVERESGVRLELEVRVVGEAP